MQKIYVFYNNENNENVSFNECVKLSQETGLFIDNIIIYKDKDIQTYCNMHNIRYRTNRMQVIISNKLNALERLLKNTTPEEYKYEIICLILLADNCPSEKDIKLPENFKDSRLCFENLSEEDDYLNMEGYGLNIDAILQSNNGQKSNEQKSKEFSLDKYLEANKFFEYTDLDLRIDKEQ